jgi:TIGR03009 family protein
MMRSLGYILAATCVGFGSVAAHAQQPGVPGAPPPQPGPPPATSNLDDHLQGWEKTMQAVKNFHVQIALTKTENVFKKEKKYDGVVLCMKPNLAILRLNYLGDPTKQDYEAYICDGKSLFQYNGLEKTITEFKLPNQAGNAAGGTDNLMIDFLAGMKSKDAKDRFELSLYREDEHYVYLSIKPKLGKDKQEFEFLNMALFGPKTSMPYLPRLVVKLNANGDQERWEFTEHRVNLPDIDASRFRYTKVPGFTDRQAPQTPMGGGQALPVRPGQPLPPTVVPQGNGTGRP